MIPIYTSECVVFYYAPLSQVYVNTNPLYLTGVRILFLQNLISDDLRYNNPSDKNIQESSPALLHYPKQEKIEKENKDIGSDTLIGSHIMIPNHM